MSGRHEIARHRARIEAAFTRAGQLTDLVDSETRSDYAKYLCVIVSGFLERSVSEMLLEHARKNGSPTLQRFVESSFKNFTNVKCDKMLSVMGSFSQMWREKLEQLLVDEVKDAIDSLVANRHQIAHGGSIGLTMRRVSSYYDHVSVVVEIVMDMCDPLPPT